MVFYFNCAILLCKIAADNLFLRVISVPQLYMLEDAKDVCER
jgi:hypothetical protein